MTNITFERVQAMLWNHCKPAKDYPKDYLVIPILEAIEIIKDNEVPM